MHVRLGAEPIDLPVAGSGPAARRPRWSRVIRWSAPVLVFLALGAAALPAAALAQRPSRMAASGASSPPLVFVGTSAVLTFAASGTASSTVTVQNDTAACILASFTLVVLPSGAPVSPYSGGQHCLKSGLSVTTLDFHQAFSTTMTGAALSLTEAGPAISAASGAAATQAITLTLRRSADVWAAGLLPLIVGVGFASLILAGTRWWLGGPVCRYVKASSSWTSQDSWATNITAVGALLGAVLTATGSTSTLLPGVQTDRFAVLSAAWGGLVVLAPLLIVFRRTAAPDKGGPGKADDSEAASPAPALTVGVAKQPGAEEIMVWEPAASPPADTPAVQALTSMMFLAAFVTLTAVGGELTTVGVLAQLSTASGGPRMFVDVVLCVAGVLTGLYAAFTIHALVASQTEHPHTHNIQSGLNRFENTSLTL